MRTYGLIGHPLSHSFSKRFFEEKFEEEHIADAVYELFPIEHLSMFEKLLENESLCGLNVTIPHKKTVMSFLDKIDEEAMAVGAVNCIKILRNKGVKTIGYNTDISGFETSLKRFITPNDTIVKALILGTGGSASAVAFVLKRMGIAYTFVSRSGSKNAITYEMVDEALITAHRLIINTTPLGMFPATEGCPQIPFQHLSPGHYCFDLIYNPANTRFMERASHYGAKTKNGIEMLEIQAEKSWEIWNDF
jgi:shikimate dehydrogenase